MTCLIVKVLFSFLFFFPSGCILKELLAFLQCLSLGLLALSTALSVSNALSSFLHEVYIETYIKICMHYKLFSNVKKWHCCDSYSRLCVTLIIVAENPMWKNIYFNRWWLSKTQWQTPIVLQMTFDLLSNNLLSMLQNPEIFR